MYEHRLHHAGGWPLNTATRRRRVRAARRRMAAFRARLAEGCVNTASAQDITRDDDVVPRA